MPIGMIYKLDFTLFVPTSKNVKAVLKFSIVFQRIIFACLRMPLRMVPNYSRIL